MRNSFCIVAMAMAMVMVAGIVMAETVDIGLGRMDRAEFAALRLMVSGDYHPSATVSTEIPKETRVAEFNRSDVDSIRQAMTASIAERNAAASASNNDMVDIGTGSMAASEFCDLNKLVASNRTNQNGGFAFICP
ncbi:MAG: hypothetical protein HGJ94_08970 [Desulfosarcina sp.]|nr:hypothetical protein [Desulfosarcina sp.]MBC2744508.1 hypothetical protein [Desulfosarcina sp.]MBC2767418.1 hypothetical protein [Desulfosarcina sp.]